MFLTGHTGFKGSWMCKLLSNAGAIVTGYSLDAPTEPSLFKIAGIENDIHSVIGDIRDMTALKAAFDEAQPEIVLHLAAQPCSRQLQGPCLHLRDERDGYGEYTGVR